jgi:hypothetical protein
MTASQILNGLGLVSGFIGSLLIWKHGLPAFITDKDGNEYEVLNNPNPKLKEEWVRRHKLTKVGVALLSAGFIFQLLGMLPVDQAFCHTLGRSKVSQQSQTSTTTSQESASKLAQKPPRDR